MKLSRFLPTLVMLVSLCVLPGFIADAWCATQPSPDVAQPAAQTAESSNTVIIPGPLRSFLRMAGMSQKVTPHEILALLAQNVWLRGYEFRSSTAGKPTEFMVLLKRYVSQARELTSLAGPEGVIRVASCNEAGPLLNVLGYRLRQGCRSDTSVETADPERAFVTIDSGFPLAQLEEALRSQKPFTYPYSSFAAPVLLTASDWIAAGKNETRKGDLLDSLLLDPALARLYWAFSRVDNETRSELRRSPGIANLEPFAAILDFYGSSICVRSGRVLVPGGTPAEAAWKDLIGADPESPGNFVVNLLSQDGGWPAAYFDVLSRLSSSKQTYFTEPLRLKRFYTALRGSNLVPGPARPVFRPNPGLMVLVTRLQIESTGEPHVPGSLDAWKDILGQKSGPKLARQWAKRLRQGNTPEKLLEAMFAFSRMPDEDSPLQLYLLLSEIDRGRTPEQQLSAQTVRMLADKFSRFGNQFLIFPEFPGLNDDSIARFLTTIDAVDHFSDMELRANTVGILQANVGLWQILARQGQISQAELNNSWQTLISPFAEVHSSAQLFDSGRTSLQALLRAATGRADLSENEMVAVLAGPNQMNLEGRQVHQVLDSRIHTVMEDQRLISLDTVFALADGLEQMAHGKNMATMLLPLAQKVREFEMPRPLFTSEERSEWTLGLYGDRQSVLRMRVDLTKLIKTSATSKELLEARGALAPLLKNALVGLNYAYYEPPGAQMLHNNALFVRSHDFSGQMSMGRTQTWQVPHLYGTGLTASGGAFLAGSLASLPYVLSETEQNFIVPENVQSLIWEGLVADLLTSAILPRWWNVTRNELHAVALHQRAGEELLEAAAHDQDLRQKVMDILSDRMLPQRSEEMEKALRAGSSDQILTATIPGETFYLAAEYRRRFPEEISRWSASGKELDDLSHGDPESVSRKRLSEDFGIPHPVLAWNYARELANGKPFPAVMGFSSRLLAESWDSNNLYWARLADEMGYSPVMLNRMVPELTRRMVEKMSATDFEDWPAILRAMRETGDEFRKGKLASLPKTMAAVGP